MQRCTKMAARKDIVMKAITLLRLSIYLLITVLSDVLIVIGDIITAAVTRNGDRVKRKFRFIALEEVVSIFGFR